MARCAGRSRATLALCAVVVGLLAAPRAAVADTVSWGANTFGQLGLATITGPEKCPEGGGARIPCAIRPHSLPVEPLSSFSAGYWHALGVPRRGGLLAWGEDKWGELGNGLSNENLAEEEASEPQNVCAAELLSVCRSRPEQVDGLAEEQVADASAGVYLSLAALRNGSVEAWGSDTSGELGDGEVDVGGGREPHQSTPQQVCAVGHEGPCEGGPYLEDVKEVAAGYWLALALRNSGRGNSGQLVAWGRDEVGQLGIAPEQAPEMCPSSYFGASACATTPVAVELPTAEKVGAIAASWYAGFALTKGGNVYAWGEAGPGLGTGRYQQLCNLSPPQRCSPKPELVPLPSGQVTAISVNYDGGLALLKNGTVMTWGERGLGDGTTNASSVPVLVPELTGVTAISAGDGYDSALLENGTVLTWGMNDKAQLGDGTLDTSLVPVPVVGLSGVSQVVSGYDFSFANGTLSPVPAAPSISGLSPGAGPVVGGTEVEIEGANLSEASIVRFGPTRSPRISLQSPTRILAVAPPGTSGTSDVTVVTPGGVSSTTNKARFKYGPPEISVVSPSAGPTAGGTAVTITGAGFPVNSEEAPEVRFGTETATAECSSTTRCTVLTPSHKSGVAEVRITVAGQKSPADPPADQFTFVE